MADKNFWDNIYKTKSSDQLSWTQRVPQTSLDLINACNLSKDSAIIDIGGGDSHLVDHLVALGYADITVLDISEEALQRSKARLGEKAAGIKWIVSDVLTYHPVNMYNLWHDRAAFHFLTEERQIKTYVNTLENSVTTGGFVVIGTFSDAGPDYCSGLPVRKYNAEHLANALGQNLQMIDCISADHLTPFNTMQNFGFCRFIRT